MIDFDYAGKPPWTYFSNTGEIALSVDADPASAVMNMAISGYDHMVPGRFDRDTQYMERDAAGEWVAAQRLAMGVSLDGNILRAVPAGADVQINTRSYTAAGGDMELSFSQPGEKTITIRLFPFLTWRGTYATD